LQSDPFAGVIFIAVVYHDWKSQSIFENNHGVDDPPILSPTCFPAAIVVVVVGIFTLATYEDGGDTLWA
jgi:hypothetical protein